MNLFLQQLQKALKLTLIIFVLMQLFTVVMGGTIGFNQRLLTHFLFTALYTLALYGTNAVFFIKLDALFVERFSKKRLFVGFAGSVVLSLIVIFLLHLFEEVVYDNKSLQEFLENEKPENYIVSSIITFFVTLTIHAVYFYKAYNENKVKEQKIIAGTANAKFESLKNQIDPHFLFNSLNVLSSLIEENPENAQRFTTSLSKIYRYVLEQKDKELVSVAEELAFAKTYMNLLKMRFENSISFQLPTDFENTEARVVPLSLQLLLENTIKHNVVSENKPLQITIFIQDNYLVVQNNLQKKEVLQDRQGVGLQNIVSRYALLSKRKVLVEQTETHFKVLIPILTKQIAAMETNTISNENLAYARAKERVEKLKGFYGNLISYCIVIPILIIVNLSSPHPFQWFWFPLLGWGMGLTFHALETFGYGKNWEEQKIQQILNKNKTNKWN
ncbi:2TM domain-containing protein [Flavobacterium sp. F-328]|uniref:2TM domain-containing protein n=1 Tax=Flavobacterium erciyesense TaxID=2825842 RepID=A0ABS5D258_9FLAO|nr:2TM domain-containing protein [Flavobacterium erciyesense]MBQ0908103.1 2TM domain-containing protein [Flavobacterium erciyesense]